MNWQPSLRTFAAILAAACFAAVVQLSPSRDLSTTHILSLRFLAFGIPAMSAFALVGIRLESGVAGVDLLWQFLYPAGFAASLSGLAILFAASDSTSAVVFAATLGLLLLMVRLRLRPRE